MTECKHPEAYVSNIGKFRVCNICGAKLPLAEEPVSEPEVVETPKKRRVRKAKDSQ